MVRFVTGSPLAGAVGIVAVTTPNRTLVDLVGAGIKHVAVYDWDLLPIGPDDLTDEECAQMMKWKMRHEDR